MGLALGCGVPWPQIGGAMEKYVIGLLSSLMDRDRDAARRVIRWAAGEFAYRGGPMHLETPRPRSTEQPALDT